MVLKLVTSGRKTLIRAIAAAASLAVLGACATKPVEPVAFLEIPRINKLTIVDLRTEKDFVTGDLSRLIIDCDFGVIALPDWTFPDKAARLERDLYAAFGDRLVGHTIEIVKYRSFVNGSANLTAFTAGAVQGATGVSIGSSSVPKTLSPKCAREKMTGGWFDPADLKNSGRPYSMDVDIRVDGKTYSATFAVSPDKDGRYPYSVIPFDYAADLVTADGKTTNLDQILARELHRRLIEDMKKGGWSVQQDRT